MFEILEVEDASKKVGVNQAFCSEAIGHVLLFKSFCIISR